MRHLSVCLDDVYVTCAPERVLDICKILEEEFSPTRTSGCTTARRGSVIPPGIETLTRVAQLTRPGAVVWRGDDSLPSSQQGSRFWGSQWGNLSTSGSFSKKADEHRTLFQSIPAVEDPQAASWLLLLMCASTRANYWLRGVQPVWTSILGFGKAEVSS